MLDVCGNIILRVPQKKMSGDKRVALEGKGVSTACSRAHVCACTLARRLHGGVGGVDGVVVNRGANRAAATAHPRTF